MDTPAPIYSLPFEKAWKVSLYLIKKQRSSCEAFSDMSLQNWCWSERYPGHHEMRDYFDNVDKALNVRENVVFNKRVIAAQFDQQTMLWTVQTDDGKTSLCKFFLLATGFTSKRLYPNIPGIDKFQGIVHHSSLWPKTGVDLSDKRVGVIGTGATGVQLIQEACKQSASVTVFQRTPNLCLPMRQRKLDAQTQQDAKKDYEAIYQQRLTTFGGYLDDFRDRSIFDDTPEEREAFFEELWQAGGFKFWIGSYRDVLMDEGANKLAYDFWARKTRARISDEAKKNILAPLVPPHPWGTKRPCLEHDYYEELSKPQHRVVDLQSAPIEKFTEVGIQTQNGEEYDLDIVVLATGFDALTGGLLDIDITTVDGEKISDRWAKGVRSYLGTTLSGCPNLFYLFAAHAPAASNGPSCIEIQGSWIVDTIVKMRAEGVRSIDPSPEAEKKWTEELIDICQKTLIPTTPSWYTGGNVPDKRVEPLIYFGGLPTYREKCNQVLNRGFEGFNLS